MTFRHHTYLAFLFAFGSSSMLQATTYFVDFQSGNDSNIGTSTTAPWKHSPGDPNAANTARSTVLAPGDIVKFKGGVTYHGEIALTRSGADGNPITYDGNTDESFGTGRAVLDGAATITTGWTRCTTAADARGNPNFANIWWTTIPPGVTNGWPQLIMDGSAQTHTAQHPNPSNRFLFDVVPEWTSMRPTQVTGTSITDSAFFTQTDSAYWNEAWVGVWVNGNAAVFRPLTGFDPTADRISWTAAITPYTNRDSYYSVFNHPALIDQPGEHAVSVAENRLYLWPNNSDNPNSHTWCVGKLANAFLGSAKHNIKIQGFMIRGYFSTVGQPGYTGCAVSISPNAFDGLDVRNNEFRDNIVKFIKNMDREWLITVNGGNGVKVIGNVVTHCFGGGTYVGFDNIEVSANRFEYLTGTAIYLNAATNTLVHKNIVHHIQGTHANGISIYSNSNMVEISRNSIKNCPSLLTYEISRNLTFKNNLIDASGQDQRINEWGGMTGYVHWLNNTLVNNSTDRILNVGVSGTAATYTLKNNIIDGGGNGSTSEIRSHNIYTGRHSWQTSGAGWTLASGEFDAQESQLFTNPSAGDWTPKPGSLAVDRGTGVLPAPVPEDIIGRQRPQTVQDSIDVGAYEQPKVRVAYP